MEEAAFLGRDELLRQVVDHLRQHRGVVVAGAPWVGRTRLLREALDRFERPHVMCRPTAAGRGIPFAGLGSLAPSRPDAPGTWMEELLERLPGPGTVVAIDGAQYLDAHSALLLFRAVEEAAITAAVSVWRGHEAPDAVTNLWTDGLLPRVEVEPLDRAASDDLVRAALGGPVETSTLLALWDSCRGYPLLLREYLLGTQRAGGLVIRDGMWVAAGPLVHTPALADAARQVLSSQGRGERRALQMLAIGGPLRPELMDRLVPAEVLDRLEQQDLTALQPTGEGYALPAPGWSAAIVDGLTSVRLRLLYTELASRAAPLETLTGDELVRVATWRVEAGLPSRGVDLARAARWAVEHGRVEDAAPLAEAAVEDAAVAGRLVLAEVAKRSGDLERAVTLLEEAGRIARAPYAAESALQAARLRFHRLHERTQAIAALDDLLTVLEGRDRLRVLGGAAMLVAISGDLARAAEMVDEVLAGDGAGRRARLDASVAGGLALLWSGRLEDGRRVIEVGLRLAAEVGRPQDRWLLGLALQQNEFYGGEPDAGLERAREGYRDSLANGATAIAAVWAVQLAMGLVVLGRTSEARLRAVEAVRLAERDDEMGVLPLACGVAAEATAMGGELAEARRWRSRMDESRVLDDVRSRVIRDRVAVALRAAEGDLEAGAERAVSAARDAASDGFHLWALGLAHEAVRLGYASRVVADAVAIGARVDGVWAEAVVRHAEVSAAEDLDGLERVADRYAALGFALPAAEAYAEAARVAAASARSGRAGLLRSRAAAIRGRIPDAVTPALRSLGTEDLTRREREVALLAARGLTSREVADRLVVSPRTVDNHLASVYRKLGIDGRGDLGAALGTDLA